MAKEKLDRQRIIRELIRNGRIANQEELSFKLQELGLIVAQATLSRDIKEMQISKLHDDEGYYYSLARPAFVRKGGSLAMDSSDSILSIEFSGVMAVIKTRPGYANMVAAIIDSGEIEEIAGTIAGDDTILIVIREGSTREDLLKSLGKLFHQIGKKRLN